MNRIFLPGNLKLIVSISIFLFNSIAAQVQIDHMPLGYDHLYSEREIEIYTGNIEREPRDPEENQSVIIKFRTTPVNTDLRCFIDLKKNGAFINSYEAEIYSIQSDNTNWTASIGSFAKGDSVEYLIRATINDSPVAYTQPHSFSVTGWDYITQVKKHTFQNNSLTLFCGSTNTAINPVIVLSFNSGSSLQSNIFIHRDPSKNSDASECTFRDAGEKIYISNEKTDVEVSLNPYHIKVKNKTDKTLVRQYPFSNHSSVGILNNNKNVFKIRENFYSDLSEKFYGFGERYNALNQRGNCIDNYVVNIWKEQGLKSYIPIPFYFTNSGYGFFLNSTYYSQFNLDKNKENKCTITANYRDTRKPFEYYLFTSNATQELITDYISVTGKPGHVEVWTLGPWISANEWDKQSEVEAALDSLNKYNILNTVVVLEAWSDEETFYIFNDASYKQKPASEFYHLDDFTFSGRWPDPVGMINGLHSNNMKIVLWNIPVLKSSQVPNKQRDIDERYAIENKYIAQNPDGTPNRLPPAWFGKSLNFDFSNQKAVDWWLGKRSYLINELKVDGFKVDGGEFVWGRDITFSNGMKGDEMRNLYANLYVDAYYRYIQKYNNEGIVFHRAGTFGAQTHPIAWNGDQNSSFKGFREAIRSVLNMSVSGIPFVAYDLAGYYDETNFSPDLYKRSVAQAALSPFMQFHSGYSGDAGLDRSPWNVARLLNDRTCIDVYKKYANLRFNLIPYLFTESEFTSETGIPLMRPFYLQFPDDKIAAEVELDYMLGNNMIVFPISEPGNKKEVYLPGGKWFDMWSMKEFAGQQSYKLDVPGDHIPVFIKAGSIVPFNLNNIYGFSEGITNKLDRYENLSFFIFPLDTINYTYHDYTTNTLKKIRCVSQHGIINVSVPSFNYNISMIIKIPGFSSINGGLTQSNSFDLFCGTENSYYYSQSNQMLYVRLKSSGIENNITINTK